MLTESDFLTRQQCKRVYFSCVQQRMQIDSPSILAESFEGNVDQYGMLPIYETFRTLLYAVHSSVRASGWK